MLVIISDLHLTDGLSGETIRENAFVVLRQRLRDLVYDASWRTDGKYRPIEEMHLLLLGDILDIIRSPSWLEAEGSPRPWTDPQASDFIARVKAINDRILSNNEGSLEILKRMSEGVPGAPVDDPEADEYKGLLTLTKRGFRGDDVQQVKVHIHYMIGNHDWFYHLPGDAYNQIRKSVVDALGLDNDPDEPFPHDVDEATGSADAIKKLFRDHNVFARHGDIYDPFNYEKEHGRDASSLGDAIVVELLGRFPAEVEKELGGELPQETVKNFRELDNVKPYAVIPGWINGLLERTVADKKIQDKVKKIWDRVADDFLEVPFVRAHDKPWRWDIVDGLQAGLKLAGGFSLQKIGDWALKFYKKTGDQEGSYYKNALKEVPYKNGDAHFIIYGHTHDFERVPLNVRLLGDHVVRQLYINSGTWRRVHKLVKDNPDSLQFYDYNVLTYLAFFQGDERRDRRFETWSGSLGVRPVLRA